jgi:putative salt-induced outer membrane protein YdiY
VDPEQSSNYFRYSGSYTFRETEQSDGSEVVSIDRYDANFTFRRDVNERWFLQNSISGRVDRIKGIDHELQESVGVGYRVRPSEKIELLFGGGGGVEDYRTEFEDTRNGLNPVASIFQELTWQPLEKVRLVQEFNYFVNPEEMEQFNYTLRTSFRYRITDLLGIELSYDQSFDNDVGDGNQKDDSRLRNAVIVYF